MMGPDYQNVLLWVDGLFLIIIIYSLKDANMYSFFVKGISAVFADKGINYICHISIRFFLLLY